MGFFDFLTGGNIQKQIARQSKRVANKNAQPEDREASALWLAENGSFEAITGLLGRFDIAIENQMKDSAEKEMVFNLLVDLGEPVLEPTRHFLFRSRHIAYPLRLLEVVGGEQALLEVIFELLDIEAAKEDFKPDRKRQLLIKMAEFRDHRIVASAHRFLNDFDEGVRYAAVETLLAQDSQDIHAHLLDTLANPEEESNRLRVRIAEAFAARHWSVKKRLDDLSSNPPAGWKLRGNYLVHE